MMTSLAGFSSSTPHPGTTEDTVISSPSQVTQDTQVRSTCPSALGQHPSEHQTQLAQQQAAPQLAQQEFPPAEWTSWQIDNRPPSLGCPFGLDDGHAGGSCVDCDDPLGEDPPNGLLCLKCLATASPGLGQLDWRCEDCGTIFPSATGQTEYCKICLRRQF